MSIEKPISTIRRAVQGLAEDRARKEGLDKPEERHYKSVFDTYRVNKMLDPESIELSIKATAKSQKLKEEMGQELFKVFDEAWIDATKNGKEEMDKMAEQLKRTLNLSRKEYKRELEEIPENFLIEKAKQIKNDPRVIEAFSGKEELLNKTVNVMIGSTFGLIKYHNDVSKDKVPQNLFTKIIKYFRNID